MHAAERLRRIRGAAKKARGGDVSSKRPERSSYELSQSLVDTAADASGALLVTWANSHHAEFALNWIAHARGAGIDNFLVGCLDNGLIEFLEERDAGAGRHLFKMPDFSSSSPPLDPSSPPSRSEREHGREKYTGWGSAGFHELGRLKVSLARLLVERHGVDVLLSDVDAVWLRDPFPYLRRFPEADVLSSSDALAPTRDRRARNGGPGRGGGAGSGEGADGLERWPAAAAAANIGVAFFRSPRSVGFLREWEAELARFDEEDARAGKGEKRWDQNVFNDLFRRGMPRGAGGREEGGEAEGVSPSPPPPPPPPPPLPRPDGLFPAFDRSLLFGILPVDLFASGHAFFVQRLPERTGAGVGLFDGRGGASSGSSSPSPPPPPPSPSGPFVVHATFQFSGDEGKRHRLRERYLWAVDGDGEDGLGGLGGSEGGEGAGRGGGGRAEDEGAAPGSEGGLGSYYDPPGGLLVVEPPPPSLLGPAIAAAAEERERIRWMQRQVALEEEEEERGGEGEEREEKGGSGRSSGSGGGKNRNATTTIPADPAALFSAHFALVHLQLRTVVAGLALASALNRTLVLPRLWCGADRWFAPHLGSIPGAAGPALPFRCPADHVLDLEMMEKLRRERSAAARGGEGEAAAAGAGGGGLLFAPPPVREAGLLSNPRTPRAVRDDVLRVVPCQPTRQSRCEGDEGASADAGVGGGGGTRKEAAGAASWRKRLVPPLSPPPRSTVLLRSGLDDAHIVAALSPFSHRRVLSFPDAAASFGGFADAGDARAFERSARGWASIWCCVPGLHPGHVWYDPFAERVPHVDRWGREWDRPWAAVAGP